MGSILTDLHGSKVKTNGMYSSKKWLCVPDRSPRLFDGILGDDLARHSSKSSEHRNQRCSCGEAGMLRRSCVYTQSQHQNGNSLKEARCPCLRFPTKGCCDGLTSMEPRINCGRPRCDVSSAGPNQHHQQQHTRLLHDLLGRSHCRIPRA